MRDIQILRRAAQELLRHRSSPGYRYFYQPRIDMGDNGFALYTEETCDGTRPKRVMHFWCPTEQQMCETIISRYKPRLEPEVEEQRRKHRLEPNLTLPA